MGMDKNISGLRGYDQILEFRAGVASDGVVGSKVDLVLRRDLALYSCAGEYWARARAPRISRLRARVARNFGARCRVASSCASPIGGSWDAWKKAVQCMASVWPSTQV